MSKKNKQRKIDKQIKHEEDKFRELIESLLFGLDEYGVTFNIIKNSMAEEFEESDNQFLKCPFAVEYSIPQSSNYCKKPFKGVMYLNESGSGFNIYRESRIIHIDDPAWFFVEYSNYLEAEIRALKHI